MLDLADLARRFRKNGVMFLDSGGYEFLRKKSYCDASDDWLLDSFLEVAADGETFDFAFSFDLFPNQGERWEDFCERLDSFLSKHDGIPKKKLVPVVHLRTEDKKWGFSDDDAGRLLDQVSSNHELQIIAVTERELGLGIATERANGTTKKRAPRGR